MKRLRNEKEEAEMENYSRSKKEKFVVESNLSYTVNAQLVIKATLITRLLYYQYKW